MSNTSVLSALAASARQHASRTVRIAGTAIGMLLLPLQTTVAQDTAGQVAPAGKAWTLRFTSGAMVATGAQRNSFKDAQLSAANFSWRLRPSLALTSTVSWARSRALDVADRGKVDVFNSDVGVEVQSNEFSPRRAVQVRLFAGSGAGVRTYNYRAASVDATNHPAGYVAVGGDVSLGRVGVRLEARDYASRFTSALQSASAVRNDVVISAGVSIRKRHPVQQ